MENYMASGEFYLDWSKERLWGFERSKSVLTVSAMCEGIWLGHEFPAADVVRVDKNNYQLIYGQSYVSDASFKNYGAHNRGISHFMELAPFKCNIHKGHRAFPNVKFFPIEETRLCFPEAELLECDKQLRDALLELPVDFIREFCGKHGLDEEFYLPQ